MDIKVKEILKRSLKDKKNQFIDSTISQLDEEFERSFDELLDESANTLTIVVELFNLDDDIADKFDKDLKAKDNIWSNTFSLAAKENNEEITEWEDVIHICEQFDELVFRWERARIFLKYFAGSLSSKYNVDYLKKG